MKKIIASKPWAVVIMLVVPLLVLAMHGVALLSRPPQLAKVVAELGSVGRFQKKPYPNNAGTYVFFFETTERGDGFFLAEVANGKRTLLYEQPEKGPVYGVLNALFLGWSPDDSCFAYARLENGWKIVVCDGRTGATQGVVPVDRSIKSAAWFTPDSFAIADDQQVLSTVRKFHDQWLRPLRFKYFRDGAHKSMAGQIEGIFCLENGSVVWQQGGTVWTCGENSDGPVNLFSSATTATMDAGTKNIEMTWYEAGANPAAPQTGLPIHGSTFVSPTRSNCAYIMAPDYTANNAVLLDDSVRAGTLTLVAPTPCKKLSILNATAHGPNTIGYVVHHADKRTDTGIFVSPDWFKGSNATYVANGRINVNNQSFSAVNSGNPKIYSADIDLTSASPVTRIEFSYQAGPGHTAILAVSGATDESFQPLAVTGFNADLITETNPASLLDQSTTATMETGIKNANLTWYETGYNLAAPDTGLPVHGSVFTSANQPDHDFIMAPDYTAKNAVLIDATVTNGALIFTTPAVFARLSFLAAVANGPNLIRYTVHRADATVDSGTIAPDDWQRGAGAAITVNGLINVSLHRFSAVNGRTPPRVHCVDIPLSRSASPITRIDFAHVQGSGHAAIFAVSGATADSFRPIPVTGYNADLITETAPKSAPARIIKRVLNNGRESADKSGQFVVESLNDEPPAIWQYVPGASAPRCAVPNREQPFSYVKKAPIEVGVVTNAAGEKLTYYLLAPVHNTARAKHPLVLAILGMNEMGFAWSHNHEAFANCGAYFVSVDRRDRDFGQWSEDVLTVYDVLTRQLPIDTNNVFLYGDSAGNWSVNDLLENKPDLWRGAIFFSPGSLPDPAKIKNQRLFFDCGGKDGDLAVRAMQFQDEAAKRGMPVTLLIHPGVTHFFRIPPLERVRLREAIITFGTR